MAKVTTNRPIVEVPPRTFTVELSEIEMASLILLAGGTNDYKMKTAAQEAVDYHRADETGPAGKYVLGHITDLNNYEMYVALRRAFNA